ncbi:MAG TPA: dihydrodipicolinate synthase family protein [Thermoleophilaceae bacterium]
MTVPFAGVGVALVTLFDDDGRPLAGATAEHAAAVVERGVRAVVVAGTTGESWKLTGDDRVELCRAVRDAVDVPVVVGTGNPDQTAAVRMTAAARDAGADAVLVLSRPGDEDPRPYYEAVRRAACDTPLLAYHFPAVSPPGIAVELLAELPVDGLKDSSGDADRLAAELDAFDGALYVGSSAYLALAGPVGATGAILGLANTDPELCARAFEGDAGAQRELLPLHVEMGRDFPAGLKRRVVEAMAAAR